MVNAETSTFKIKTSDLSSFIFTGELSDVFVTHQLMKMFKSYIFQHSANMESMCCRLIDWVEFSATSGKGRTNIIDTAIEVNPNDDDRMVYIYVSSEDEIID